MRLKSPFFVSVISLVFLAATYLPINNGEKEAMLIQTIIQGLDQLHFQPQQIDHKFSQKVYDLYLERLDGRRRWLTEESVNMLSIYKNMLDDEVRAGSYEFFETSLQVLNAGIDKTQGYYREILAEPFTFDGDDVVELDGEKIHYAANDVELKQRWYDNLKYEVLTRVVSELEKQKDGGEEMEIRSLEAIEKEAREEVLELYDNWYERIEKLKRTDRLSSYLNVITNVYDPHTGYYEPIDKENFDIRMSGRLEGIGARLQTDGDFTKVVDIVVGGPAWKGKELEENDQILKVAQDTDEPVNIKGMVINDVVSKIRGDKGTVVKLTVKKVDGTEKVISITRDVVIMEEGFAKSLIMDGAAEDEKIGYIYLPRFYADFQDKNGRFCAEDVALEVEKLKKENVDGIVLDLRNNGGGSLRDVVKMSGLFIEEGPIVQVKYRARTPEVLEDVDPRVQYNGPLLVLVNHFSASASEILAAAMQDYGRAVIVGSNSTFGKGTVQRFFDLDRAVRGNSDLKPFGQIKLTTQKFYRINGGSTQLKGVVPDIILPDNYHYITTGEKEHDYPLEWTEIPAVEYTQNAYRLKNVETLRRQSEQRVQKNSVFQKIYENADRLKTQREDTEYPLNLEKFQAMEEEQQEISKQYKDMFEEIVNGEVKNLEVDLPSIHADESKQARNDDWIKSVQKDIYIKESLNIMHDMLKLK